MDTLAALAFGGEPALERYMKERPVNREENILTKDMWSAVLCNGLFITALTIFFLLFEPFRAWFTRNGQNDGSVFLTAFFSLFVFLVTFNSFNIRTEKLNIFENIFENKGFLKVITGILFLQVLFTFIGGNILRVVPLNLMEWVIILLISLLIIPFDFARKIILKKIQ
jgi:Ca2+-transporting ATPase